MAQLHCLAGTSLRSMTHFLLLLQPAFGLATCVLHPGSFFSSYATLHFALLHFIPIRPPFNQQYSVHPLPMIWRALRPATAADCNSFYPSAHRLDDFKNMRQTLAFHCCCLSPRFGVALYQVLTRLHIACSLTN